MHLHLCRYRVTHQLVSLLRGLRFFFLGRGENYRMGESK